MSERPEPYEYTHIFPAPDTILICNRCRRQILRTLPGRGYWCYTCGDRPEVPALVYDRRR